MMSEGEELRKLEPNFENSGLYPVRLTPEEVQAYKDDRSLVEKRFAELARERWPLAGYRRGTPARHGHPLLRAARQ